MLFCNHRYINLFLFALLTIAASKAVTISEIMYDPAGADTDREWIELYNNDIFDINLTGWKFLEGGTNHAITLVSGSSVLNSGKFAVIAENPSVFLSEFSSFDGILFDSSFDLSNSGESLVLKNSSLAVMENITYHSGLGGNGTGDSLQRVSDDWCAGSPTPGHENSCGTVTPNTTINTDSGDCDLELKVSSNDNVYDSGESIDYELSVNDLICSGQEHEYTITYQIENLFGDFLRTPYESTYSIKCSDTSSHTKKTPEFCGTEAYLIKAKISDAGCNDVNSDNNRDEILVAVRSKDPGDADCKNSAQTKASNSTASTISVSIVSASIKRFYTLASNFYPNRTINLYADIENLEDSVQKFQLLLGKTKKDINLGPKSSDKFEFSVTLPLTDANYTLKLMQGKSLVDEKSLNLDLAGSPQSISEDAAQTNSITGAVVWTSGKTSSTIAMLLFISVLVILVTALLISKPIQKQD